MAKGAFFREATVDICAFICKNAHNNTKGIYIRLENFKGDMKIQGEKAFTAISTYDPQMCFEADAKNFAKIPGSPVAYWVSEAVIKTFSQNKIVDYAYPKQGLATGDNSRFLRFWQEINFKKFSKFDDNGKWFPCNKGGQFRRWYGNNDYVVDWENDGYSLKHFKGAVLRNTQFYFKAGITWSSLSMYKLAMRYSPKGNIFESKGSVCFPHDNENLTYLLGLANSNVAQLLLGILSPTIDYHEGPMGRVPCIINNDYKKIIDNLVKENIALSKADWDSRETSWDFEGHPLL